MSNFKSIILFTILFYIKYAASLRYVPPDKKVETVQAGSYTIGVEDAVDLGITKCHFTGDTGLNCSFEVGPIEYYPHPNYCNYMSYKHDNTVLHHGRQGYCQIRVDMVENTGPINWTLRAENSNGTVVLYDTFHVYFIYEASLMESRITLYEHASFVNYMTQPTNLTSCTVKFKNTTYQFHLDSHSEVPVITPYSSDDGDILSRVSSLDRGICGFKYTDATSIINSLQWTLDATDYKGRLYRGKFTTAIKSKIKTYTREEVYLGDSFLIECGDHISSYYSYDTEFCHLYNPSAELVNTIDCKYESQFFTMKDIGRWICYVGTPYSMDRIQYITELVRKVDPKVLTWFNETDHHVQIGCRLNVKRNSFVITSCKMIKPNSEVLNLHLYPATDRYDSIGTDFNSSVCSMQIQKPLQDDEHGLWQCEIGLGPIRTTGDLIDVNKTEHTVYPKLLKVAARLDEPFTVSCNVPYSSEFCEIEGPNTTPSQNETTYRPRLGSCSISIGKATLDHAGRWVCSFAAQKTGTPEDEIIIEVSVAEILTYGGSVHGHIGGTVTILCHSSGSPLKYCRFTNPKGETYYIHNHENSSSLSYYGKGMEYGECGIQISNITVNDFGTWACTTEIINKYGRISRIISVLPE